MASATVDSGANRARAGHVGDVPRDVFAHPDEGPLATKGDQRVPVLARHVDALERSGPRQHHAVVDQRAGLSEDPGVAKRAAREQALARRDALSPERRERLSAAICVRAAALPELQAAGTLLLFGSFRTEIDTSPLIA